MKTPPLLLFVACLLLLYHPTVTQESNSTSVELPSINSTVPPTNSTTEAAKETNLLETTSEAYHNNDTGITTPTVTSGLLSPQVLKALQQAAASFPGLKGLLNSGLHLNASQLDTFKHIVQALTKAQSGQSPSVTDILQVIESSGLLGPLANNTAVNDVLGKASAFFNNFKKMSTNVNGSPKWKTCWAQLNSLRQGIAQQANWTYRFLDSSGRPETSIMRGNIKFFGNSEECRSVSYTDPSTSSTIEGNMCRAYIPIAVNTHIAMVPGTQKILQWDFCLPKSCLGSDLTAAFTIPMACTADLDLSSDARAIVAIVILSLFGALLAVGTLLDLYLQYCTFHGDGEVYLVNGHSNGIVNGGMELNETGGGVSASENGGKLNLASVSHTVDLPGKNNTTIGREYQRKSNDKEQKLDIGSLPRWQQALLAFSVPRNTEKILSVKAAPGAIGCLHGIRVLSIAWVILGHTVIFSGMSSYKNPLDLVAQVGEFSFQLIINAPLSVDTFFVMSGLLTAYLFMKTIGKKGRITVKEFIMYYVHRYWRLTPSLMIWIMIVACLIKFIGEGNAAWTDFYLANNCRKNWWTNLLYINNVYKQHESCVGVSWYLAHDMQFYVLAPLALIPWAYGKKLLGFLVTFIFIGIHLASTIWLELKYNIDQLRSNKDYGDQIYFKPYTRVAPYAIGLITGWILWRTKTKARMNKYLVVLGWATCFAAMLIFTLVTYDENKDFKLSYWTKAGRTAFETLRRPVWALAVSWMIFACASGYGGYINSILSWNGWLPLSRLTYSAFLIHMTIMLYENQASEFTAIFTWTALSYQFLGYFVMAFAVGYVLTVVVESPMLGLEKALLK